MMNNDLISNVDLKCILFQVAVLINPTVSEKQWSRNTNLLSSDDSNEVWFKYAEEYLGIKLSELSSIDAIKPTFSGNIVLLVQTEDEWCCIKGDTYSHLVEIIEYKKNGLIYSVTRNTQTEVSAHSMFKDLVKQNKTIIKKISLCTFLINIIALTIPLYMNAVYDRIIPGGASVSLWTLSVGVLLCGLFEYFLRNYRSNSFIDISRYLLYVSEPNVISQLTNAELSDQTGWGNSIVYGFQKWRRLRSLFWVIASSAFIDIFFTFIYFVLVAWIGGIVALVPLLIVISCIFCVFSYDAGLKSKPLKDNFFSLTANQFLLHRALGSVDRLNERFYRDSEEQHFIDSHRYKLQSLCNTRFAVLGTLQTVLIVIVCYYLLNAGLMQAAGIFAIILLSGKIIQPWQSLISIIPVLREIKECMSLINISIKNQAPKIKPKCFITGDDSWTFENVDLIFNKGKNVLNNISLRIQKGERIAVLGPSGSGKTSLLNCFIGLYSPSHGRIYNNGKILDMGAISDLKSSLYYHWQLPEIPCETMLSFLTLGSNDIDSVTIKETLNKIGLIDAVLSWKNGLNTPIGNLPQLSNKQYEKLSLARFILNQQKLSLIILDSPSEHLDRKTENLLKQSINDKLLKHDDTTLIIATDRQEMLELVERVIVLNDGSIMFDGSVKDFIAMNSKHEN